jgi:hypothetical protein
MYSFNARGAQKRKNDSQVVSLFTLLESARAKAARKYLGEIDPRSKLVAAVVLSRCEMFWNFCRPKLFFLSLHLYLTSFLFLYLSFFLSFFLTNTSYFVCLSICLFFSVFFLSHTLFLRFLCLSPLTPLSL